MAEMACSSALHSFLPSITRKPRRNRLFFALVSSPRGVGNRNGPRIEVKELMQNVERELEVTATVCELHLECERQRQDECPESASVGVNSSRILALEYMIATSSSSLDSMSSQLLEAENRKPVFSGWELWGKFCSLADAEEVMNFLINLASSSRCLLRDKEVECREKDSEIRDLKEEMAKRRTFGFQRASVSQMEDFSDSDKQVSRQHGHREPNQGNAEAPEEEQLKVSSDVRSQNAMDDTLMASGVCSSVHELEESELPYFPESDKEHHDWNSSSFSAFEYDEPLSPTEASYLHLDRRFSGALLREESIVESVDISTCSLPSHEDEEERNFEYDEPLSPTEASYLHLDRCVEIFRDAFLHEESIVESADISTCSLPSHEEERNSDGQQSSMTDTLISAEEPVGNIVGDEQQQHSGKASASQLTMELDTLLTNGIDNTIEKEYLIEIGCQLKDETVPSSLSMEEPKSSNDEGNGSPAQYDGLNNPGHITSSMELELHIVDKEADSISTDKVCPQDELMFTVLDASATVGNNESGGRINGLSTTADYNQFEASTLFQEDDLVSSASQSSSHLKDPSGICSSCSCACKKTKCECTSAADICGLSCGSTSRRCSNGRVDQRLAAHHGIQQELSKADINEKTFAAAAIRWGAIRVKYLHEPSKANMFQNMNILREYGVPESNILALLISYPKTVAIASSRFREISKEVKEKGFNPLMVTFILAMVTLRRGMQRTWEKSVDCYKKFGLPDEDVILAFREKPYVMEMSEEKITEVMNYYTNVMGLDPSFVCQRLPLTERSY